MNIWIKIYLVISTIVIAILLYLILQNKKSVGSPVEEVIKIDSLVEHNHNIQVTVKHLENEKQEIINKVSSLDNDSTVKLFYELLQDN